MPSSLVKGLAPPIEWGVNKLTKGVMNVDRVYVGIMGYPYQRTWKFPVIGLVYKLVYLIKLPTIF